MAKGRKAKVKEIINEEPAYSSWTTPVKLLKSLITPYRISGKVDDIIEVPSDLVDELVTLKKVKVI